jgi:hypothetical protein
MEAVMSYDSWLTHNPALDGIEQDVELFYECQNDWPVDPADPKGDWSACGFAEIVELPDTWVTASGVALGELECPNCGVTSSFEFEVPVPEREWDE